MNTQVVFNIDKKLKERAMARARKLGIPLSAFLKLATREFAEGELGLDVRGTEALSEKSARELRAAESDVHKNKNLSQTFKSADEAIAYLKKCVK